MPRGGSCPHPLALQPLPGGPTTVTLVQPTPVVEAPADTAGSPPPSRGPRRHAGLTAEEVRLWKPAPVQRLLRSPTGVGSHRLVSSVRNGGRDSTNRGGVHAQNSRIENAPYCGGLDGRRGTRGRWAQRTAGPWRAERRCVLREAVTA